MWRHEDDRGRKWDVAVGRESWGTFYAIFMERGADGEVRQVALDATSRADAARLLDGMKKQEWTELFDSTLPKTLE